MKNDTHKPSTSQKLVHNNSLLQEIPEDSAETIKGGAIAVIFILASTSSGTNIRRLPE